MANISVDFKKHIGTIKPVHGVGQGPAYGTGFSLFHYLTDAGIPYSRLHDVGGPYGGFRWVDVPNIFRDFDADENDPASYDFTFTDMHISALMKAKVEPYFRLGVTIENAAAIKAYRIFPPADFAKWARICEHIIRHYTEGWADGFNYEIEYWEIWNEPDSKPDPMQSMMWRGTPEQYFEFYSVAAKHLKSCFPHIKIGGYGSCGFYYIFEEKRNQPENTERFTHYFNFFHKFIKSVKENGAPLDFFSWHIYDSNMMRIKGYMDYVRAELDKAGFEHTESSCNEWNADSGMRGTYLHASKTCSTLLIFQNGSVDTAMFYDARFGAGRYSGMFNPETSAPYPAYYAFVAYNRLYELKNQSELILDDERLFAAAAENGGRGCLLIANPTTDDIPLEISANGDPIVSLITTEGKMKSPGDVPVTDPRCDGAIPFPSVIPAESFISIIYNT